MKAFYLIILALLPSACAFTPHQPPSPQQLAAEHGYLLGEQVKKIHDYEINGWNYISNRSLIIPARPGLHYLLILDRECPQMRGREVIGFTSTINTLQAGFDAVVINDRHSGIHEKCYIDQIYKVTKAAKRSET